MTDMTPAVLAAKLSTRAEDVARWLLPNGRRVGNDWRVGSIKGEEGDSCKIAIEGENAGRWADFAQGDISGDLLDLICRTQEIGLREAIDKGCEFLGIERVSWGSRERRKEYVEPERPKNARAVAKAPAVDTWLASRKITPEVIARYKLVADGDGTVVFPYMRDGKLLHLKYRDVRQKKFWSSANTELCLFGWQALDPHARAVCLTEGEMDTLALAEYGVQALSVPYGAGKKGKQDWIENEWDFLERFDTIFITIDMDGPGIQTVQEMAERLGRHRCKVVKLPRKDANACLMEGIPKDQILRSIREAKTLDPPELRNASEFRAEIIERFHPVDKSHQGFLMPWLSMYDSFLFEWGATTVIAGYSSHGKSEITGQLTLDAIRQHHRCCVASFEFKSSKWIARQIRQATRHEQPPVELIDKAMEWIEPNLWAVDIYGTAKADRTLEIFEYAHRRYGVRVFVIDNFTKLGIADDDLAEQKRVMNAITEFAVRHDVHIILVHHLRKEETDYSAANMSKLSLKGSSSIGDLADNIFLIWRNKSKEKKLKDPKFSGLPDEEKHEIRGAPDTIFVCEKYRNGDDEPRLPLWFDKKSHLWTEEPQAPVYQYVKVSA
jgi:twinkle protein